MASRRTEQTEEPATGGPHEQTWGATEAAKAKWFDTNADKIRKDVAAANEEADAS